MPIAKKADAERRTMLFHIRVSPKEYRILERRLRAARAGKGNEKLTIAGFIRARALR